MTGLADFATLEPGFDDLVRGSQAAFRAVLEAVAHSQLVRRRRTNRILKKAVREAP